MINALNLYGTSGYKKDREESYGLNYDETSLILRTYFVYFNNDFIERCGKDYCSDHCFSVATLRKEWEDYQKEFVPNESPVIIEDITINKVDNSFIYRIKRAVGL